MTSIDVRPQLDRTRPLLLCGAAAGPLFVLVSGVQVLTRDGFDLMRHPLSLLSLGPYGWIQTANFVITGALFVAGAVGMRRAMAPGRGAVWGPRLIGFFGASLVWAGMVRADPADGFPVGTPAGHHELSWHGIAHSMAPGLGMIALIIACFVVAGWFAGRGRRGWAVASVVTGLLLFTPDLVMGRTGFTAVLAAAGVLGWGWASAVAGHLALAAPGGPLGGRSARPSMTRVEAVDGEGDHS
jgi:hypothetical protein